MEFTYQTYIDDVLSGKILTGRLSRLAVERHVYDLKKLPSKGFYFDEKAANFAIEFFQFCRHIKGQWAGKPIILDPWQQFIVAMVFGWRRKDGTRRFRTVYTEVARKNGKSTMLSGIGLKLMIADGEPGAEIYAAAVDKEQAMIIWGEAKKMVIESPDFSEMIGAYQFSLSYDSNYSTFKPLSRDTKNKDGLNIHGGLIDEYHAHPTDEIYNVIESGMAARRQPLLWIITTAGFNQNSSCKRERDAVVRILERTIHNEEYFGIIYTLDENDDYHDEKNWIKANPGLGVSVKLEQLRGQYRKAKGSASKLNEFIVKRLNIWTQTHTRWMLPEKWNALKQPFDRTGLAGRKAVLAIDLSTNIDLSGYCLTFLPEEPGDKYIQLWRFFVPEENVRERSLAEDVPYEAWIENGFVEATPGASIDYDLIEQRILEDCEIYDVIEIPHDPHNANQLVGHLLDKELVCVAFHQGITKISPAVKAYEKAILDGPAGNLIVEVNPVMDYMMGCAEVYSDPNGNLKIVKPDRRKSSKRIDGVIMGLMGYYRAIMTGDEETSVYEERGLLTL